VDCLHQAVAAYREVGNRYGLGWASSELGTVHGYLGSVRARLHAVGASACRAREIGHRYGEGRALNGLGLASLQAERHGDALDHLHQALALHREIGAPYPEGETVLCLAEVHRAIGDLDLSRTHYLRAVEITRYTNNLRGQARAHQGLADLLLSGDPQAAAEHRRWRARSTPRSDCPRHGWTRLCALMNNSPGSGSRSLESLSTRQVGCGHP